MSPTKDKPAPPSVRWSLTRSIILVLSITAIVIVLFQWRLGVPFVRTIDLSEYEIEPVGPNQTWTVFLPRDLQIPNEMRDRVIVEVNGRRMFYFENKAADLARARDGSFWVRYRRVNFRLVGLDPEKVSRAVLKVPQRLPVWAVLLLVPLFSLIAWAASRRSSPRLDQYR
ncbi:MAG: hypothetical protein AAGJ79_12875 [Verrucomicrobiota bacterium]